MRDVVIVKSETEEGARALLNRVCKNGDLVPVMEPEPMLGRENRWQAQAAPAEQPRPARRPAASSLEFRMRRGHR